MTHNNVNRNDPCPCGSGKKYKNCCLGTATSGFNRTARIAVIGAVVSVVIAAILYATVGKDAATLVAALGVLGAGAWWLFSDPPSSRGSGDPGSIGFGG
jgi:hypothetical protein